ncbi:MAG: NUMOD3 domain-containing DNA-binding protein, partial [candidate division Zixibacteria bacterium]|nr:NUMOD3 domain-containing DNA-binding protein [candidate division Zixibacteria bacterium]
YGKENFEFTIIEEVPPMLLISREQSWIDFYDSANYEKGYNIFPSAAGFWIGRHHTEEAKKRIGLSSIGRRGALGMVHTPEAKEKIRQARLGKKYSPEPREKIREVTTGRKKSKEEIEKIRIGLLKYNKLKRGSK